MISNKKEVVLRRTTSCLLSLFHIEAVLHPYEELETLYWVGRPSLVALPRYITQIYEGCPTLKEGIVG